MRMLDFLLENDVVISSTNTDFYMTADTSRSFEGEFVVYDPDRVKLRDVLYRGDDFETAMRYLQNNKFEDEE